MTQHSLHFFDTRVPIVETEEGEMVELLPSPHAARQRLDHLNHRAVLELAGALPDAGEPFTLRVGARQPAPPAIRKANRRRRLAHALGF